MCDNSKWKKLHNMRIKELKAGSCPHKNQPTTSGINVKFRTYLSYFAHEAPYDQVQYKDSSLLQNKDLSIFHIPNKIIKGSHNL